MSQPNFLWICTDQQRCDTLGCYGNEFVKTPNLDKLAANGVVFENAFCQSPVCTPSRSSFLTGRYPRTTRCRQNGQAIPEDEVLVTRLLAEAGYDCGLSGKLHLSPCHPDAIGIDGVERRINDGYQEFYWSHHPHADWKKNEYIHWLEAKGIPFKEEPQAGGQKIQLYAGMPAELSHTAWCAEKAINFIEKRADSPRPWLFSVNIFDPHHHFDPPRDYYEYYLKLLDKIPLPNYTPGELEQKTRFQRMDHRGGYNNNNGDLDCKAMSDEDHRRVRAAYWAMVNLIDEQVGRMLTALEQTGQLENTIVIFTSDHGEMLGDHGIYLKGPFFYEPAVNVPLIVSQPGQIAGGRREKGLVELVDLAQTLLDAAALEYHPGMQGRSLWPILKGEANSDQHREDVYCEYYNSLTSHKNPTAHATMVRTKRYKLVAVHGLDEGELYDLEKDPCETTNRWSDTAYQDVKLMMLKRLCDRMAWTVDPLPVRQSGW